MIRHSSRPALCVAFRPTARGEAASMQTPPAEFDNNRAVKQLQKADSGSEGTGAGQPDAVPVSAGAESARVGAGRRGVGAGRRGGWFGCPRRGNVFAT
jgi:hypothetical protein